MGEQKQTKQIKLSKFFFMACLSLVLALGVSFPLEAFATPTAAEKQAEADAARESLDLMQTELNKASDDYFTALAEQEQAQANMDESQARIDEIDVEIADIQEKLGTRANSMYRSGSISFLDLLLGSNTFEEFINNWDFLNRMNEEDSEMVQQSKDLKVEAEEQRAFYAEQEELASEKAEEALAIKDAAESTVESMQSIYDNLSSEAAELLEAEQKAAEEAAAAAAAAAEAERQAAQQAAQNNGGTSSNNNSSGGSYSGGSSSSGGSSAPSYNASTGNATVDRAYSYLGAAYVWGGCSPSGFDCSGFVSYCLTGSYSRLGTTYTFLTWPQVSSPQPGDVCVNSGHTGIYIGGGQMIHASSPGVGVIIGPVQSGMIYVRY